MKLLCKERAERLAELCDDSVKAEEFWEARSQSKNFIFIYSGREYNHPRYHCYINKDGSYDSIAISYPFGRGYKEQDITPELEEIVDEMIDYVWIRRVVCFRPPSIHKYYSELRRDDET